MKLVTRGFVLAGLFTASNAAAALTVSEQAQVREFVASANFQNVSRLRAMVARTDLTTEETVASLREAMAPVVFDAPHVVFARELAFGGPSMSTRPLLAVAVVRSLLARADAVLANISPDSAIPVPGAALAELERIYAFIDSDVANAGHPQGAAHDPQIGITSSSYDECVKALASHIERNPRWLKGDAKLLPAAARLRAQVQLALFELLNDAPTRRLDAAERLGIMGARRALLIEQGILVLDTGVAEDARVDRLRAFLDRLPSVRVEVEGIYFGDDHPGLHSRGSILATKAPLEAAVPAATPPASLFADDVEPGVGDAALAQVEHELARLVVRRALEKRKDLQAAAERDLRAAGTDPRNFLGKRAAANLEEALADGVELLITDAPRALDLTFVRFLSAKPSSAAILSDALGALAALAPPGNAPALTLGRPKGSASELTRATNLQLAPTGAVTSFTVDGHTWALTRSDPAGPVATVRRDGAEVTMAMLPTARLPATAASSWSAAGTILAKMQGSPRAGVAAGPRIRLVGTSDTGFDAIAAPAPGDNVLVEADLSVQGEAAGVALRAVSGTDSFRGAALVIRPGPSPQIVLVQKEDNGFESYLAAPYDARSLPTTVHLKLSVRGTKIEAIVGDAILRGTLPSTFAHGDIALCAKKGAIVEANHWTVKRL